MSDVDRYIIAHLNSMSFNDKDVIDVPCKNGTSFLIEKRKGEYKVITCKKNVTFCILDGNIRIISYNNLRNMNFYVERAVKSYLVATFSKRKRSSIYV